MLNNVGINNAIVSKFRTRHRFNLSLVKHKLLLKRSTVVLSDAFSHEHLISKVPFFHCGKSNRDLNFG